MINIVIEDSGLGYRFWYNFFKNRLSNIKISINTANGVKNIVRKCKEMAQDTRGDCIVILDDIAYGASVEKAIRRLRKLAMVEMVHIYLIKYTCFEELLLRVKGMPEISLATDCGELKDFIHQLQQCKDDFEIYNLIQSWVDRGFNFKEHNISLDTLETLYFSLCNQSTMHSKNHLHISKGTKYGECWYTECEQSTVDRSACEKCIFKGMNDKTLKVYNLSDIGNKEHDLLWLCNKLNREHSQNDIQ